MRNEEFDYVTRGFPVGFVAPPAFEGGRRMHFLYNHVRIVLKYHEDYEAFKGARIVGFQIIPFSINHMWDRLEEFDEYTTTLSSCNEMNPAQNDPGNFQSVEEADEVIYGRQMGGNRSELNEIRGLAPKKFDGAAGLTSKQIFHLDSHIEASNRTRAVKIDLVQ